MITDVLVLVKTRRSIRKWKEKEVPDILIDKLIDAARWAPSSCNRQTCKFLIIHDEEKRKLIGNAVIGGVGFASKAPIHILVLVDVRPYHLPVERHLPFLDAAAAIENMLLMAHSLGLGACWLNWTVSRKNEEKIRRINSIPEHMMPIALIALGYPDVVPKPPARKKIKDFTEFESF